MARCCNGGGTVWEVALHLSISPSLPDKIKLLRVRFSLPLLFPVSPLSLPLSPFSRSLALVDEVITTSSIRSHRNCHAVVYIDVAPLLHAHDRSRSIDDSQTPKSTQDWQRPFHSILESFAETPGKIPRTAPIPSVITVREVCENWYVVARWRNLGPVNSWMNIKHAIKVGHTVRLEGFYIKPTICTRVTDLCDRQFGLISDAVASE